ncbi:MAG TPA: nitroreductase/quinone reductase family protein [Acidimicrobiales bacterium]
MPSDLGLKAMNAVHRCVLKVSGGRLGWKVARMPVVELTTRGRKSGEPRTVMLTSPVQEGDTVVLVASRGGDDHHPAWFLNLQAEPRVEARVGGGERRTYTARVATPEERERLWPQVTAVYRGYANYQRKTDRQIPLVLLDPA